MCGHWFKDMKPISKCHSFKSSKSTCNCKLIKREKYLFINSLFHCRWFFIWMLKSIVSANKLTSCLEPVRKISLTCNTNLRVVLGFAAYSKRFSTFFYWKLIKIYISVAFSLDCVHPAQCLKTWPGGIPNKAGRMNIISIFGFHVSFSIDSIPIVNIMCCMNNHFFARYKLFADNLSTVSNSLLEMNRTNSWPHESNHYSPIRKLDPFKLHVHARSFNAIIIVNMFITFLVLHQTL